MPVMENLPTLNSLWCNCPRSAHFSGLNTRRHLVCISCNKETCDDYSQDVILKSIVSCGLFLVSQLRKKQLDSKHHLIQVGEPHRANPLKENEWGHIFPLRDTEVWNEMVTSERDQVLQCYVQRWEFNKYICFL